MTNQNYIKYRPDIDGFRALAVLSVLVFHFNPSWLHGGFLGVDIFFVISGYLITSIIKRQIMDDRFTFMDFYTRRIKRILPLFFTVLFATFLASLFILLPEDYSNFWRSARYAMQFRANRAFTGQDYFDSSTEEKPLLHLWSLAIEEQFYFIWPLVVFIAYFFTKKQKKQSYILFILALLGIILSTTLAEFSIRNNPGNSYYLLQNRAAELLVGCALALNPYTINNSVKRFAGGIGALVLILCFVFYKSTTPFPGILALVPTIAAAFFILDDTDGGYKKVFNNRIVRLVGLWSFSLYLWHWPILALMRYVSNSAKLPLSWILIAAILTFTLSILSYYLVENSVRKRKWKFTKSLIIIYIFPLSLMFGLNSLVKFDYNFINEDKTRWFNINEGCWQGELGAACSVGNQESKTHYLLIGDSHAMHLSSMMNEVGKAENIKIDVIASGGCPIFFGYVDREGTTEECAVTNKYFELNWKNYDAIIFSQLFYGHIYMLLNQDTHKTYLEDFKKTVEIISEHIPVIIMSDVPEYDYHPIRGAWLAKKDIFGFAPILKDPIGLNLLANPVLEDIANTISNVHYIDLIPYVNTLLENKELIYRDENHLNPYGSKMIGEMFIQEQKLRKSFKTLIE